MTNQFNFPSVPDCSPCNSENPHSLKDPCPHCVLCPNCDPSLVNINTSSNRIDSYPSAVRRVVTTWKVNYLISNRPNYASHFVRRFTSRGVLNSPWAMIPAPCECGFPPGSFLAGNNGDGHINVFDCEGNFVGSLLGQSHLPIHIEGLWGLAPHYTNFSEIFFTSSENTIGMVGSIVKDQVIYF